MFHQHPVSRDQLVNLVRQGLCTLNQVGAGAVADREYSNQIKQILVDAARTEGRLFETHPKMVIEDYTYDVSWWNDRQRMVLAVEVEWYGAKYALEKLFAAECPLKLLVTGSKNLPVTQNLLEKSLRRYSRHIGGEYYIWVAVDRAKAGSLLRAFECAIDSPGHNPSLAFTSVEVSFSNDFGRSLTLAA